MTVKWCTRVGRYQFISWFENWMIDSSNVQCKYGLRWVGVLRASKYVEEMTMINHEYAIRKSILDRVELGVIKSGLSPAISKPHPVVECTLCDGNVWCILNVIYLKINANGHWIVGSAHWNRTSIGHCWFRSHYKRLHASWLFFFFLLLFCVLS